MEAYLQKFLKDKTVTLMPFTTAVIATYVDDKKIQEHCDQRWTPTGEFMDNQNSQVEGTATVVLVIGGCRSLDFVMYGHNGNTQIEVGVRARIDLKHGSLFVLDPSDEEPTKRNNFDQYSYTFYKHSSDGVEGRNSEMSIGIVFRTTNHLVEVYRDTGLAVLDDNLQMNMIRINKDKTLTKIPNKLRTDTEVRKEREELEKRTEMLKEYMKGKVHQLNKRGAQNQRMKNEEHYKALWKNCKDTYLPICSVNRQYVEMIVSPTVSHEGGGVKRKRARSDKK